MDRQSVLVAMSGGVDSSVAAYLLIGEGYSVSGAMMRLFSGPSVGLPEDTQDDAGAAAAAALAAWDGFFGFGFENEFRREVIEKFADGYLSGVTQTRACCVTAASNSGVLQNMLFQTDTISSPPVIMRARSVRLTESIFSERLRTRPRIRAMCCTRSTSGCLRACFFPSGRYKG